MSVFLITICFRAEKTWKVLEDAIREINNHNASGLSFEELYRYGACTPHVCLHPVNELVVSSVLIGLYAGMLTIWSSISLVTSCIMAWKTPLSNTYS